MNSTERPTILIFHSAFVTTSVFCFVSTILICVGTSTVLYAIFKNPRRDLRTPSSLLFINLSLSDFLTGFLLGAMMTADSLMDVYGKNSFLLDGLVFVVGSLLLFVNNLTIGAISVDRLLAVSIPLKYKSLVTVKSVKIVILMIWVLSLLICLLPVLGVSRNVFLLLYSHSHVSLPFLSLTAIYITIFRILAKQRHEIRHLQTGINGESMTAAEKVREKRRMERDRHLTATVVLVMLSFSISSLPFLICVHLMIHVESCNNCVDLYWERTITSIFYFSGRFVLLNAVLDPLLIVWRMPKMREAVRLSTIWKHILPRDNKVRTVAPATGSVMDTFHGISKPH